MPDDTHRFGDDRLTATVRAEGAELQSLRDAGGGEWLWQAGPEWPRHAPILFPIVGRLPGDTLRHAGQPHRMTQHGFARDSRFTWLWRDGAGCALRLEDNDATRAAYPFAFALDVEWAVAGGALSCTATVLNPGDGPLPFLIGGHPAFSWPLPGAASAEGHHLTFAGIGALAARRLTGGLLDASEYISLRDGTLPLNQSLFEKDAIVLPDFPARKLRYAAPGAALEMQWDGYSDFGLWSKPGASFLCLEPWCGTAAPLGWDGEFMNRPGATVLAPGQSRRFSWQVRPERSPD
ncbi:aldose 1-epimerase family protein [Roseomonas populi]|uniref:Aldose 1-epimerase family protein n=1 Tax=Roseomonas populi TaxID=3121582 RepID=A0ABT1X2D6_9PROT|nr:aldose 1-epimerase family protein [Roseomonas pecuniae]MCR0981879.1 aldose 1-epimerase family protein [Roseomonas pecuniae]